MFGTFLELADFIFVLKHLEYLYSYKKSKYWSLKKSGVFMKKYLITDNLEKINDTK